VCFKPIISVLFSFDRLKHLFFEFRKVWQVHRLVDSLRFLENCFALLLIFGVSETH
jgi:hypothetical protein